MKSQAEIEMRAVDLMRKVLAAMDVGHTSEAVDTMEFMARETARNEASAEHWEALALQRLAERDAMKKKLDEVECALHVLGNLFDGSLDHIIEQAEKLESS